MFPSPTVRAIYREPSNRQRSVASTESTKHVPSGA